MVTDAVQRKDPEVELEEDDDSQFVLDDYESDSESGMKRSGDDSNFSPEVRELMAK